MATSKMPTAIDGLLALCNAQTGTGGTLENVSIYDGPSKQSPSEERQLYIGYDEVRGFVDTYAAEGTQQHMAMGGSRQEMFSILCAAVARSGDDVIKTQRDRAFVIVAAVENLIRLNVAGSDITLGGAVLKSHVSGAIRLLQLQTTEGAYAKVSFHVECLAAI